MDILRTICFDSRRRYSVWMSEAKTKEGEEETNKNIRMNYVIRY